MTLRIGTMAVGTNETEILIWGEQVDLLLLADGLRNLRPSEPSQSELVKGSVSVDGTVLRISVATLATTISHIADAISDFDWVVNERDLPDFVEKIEMVARCSNGHNYLDSADGEITVVVSKNEYSADFLSDAYSLQKLQ